MKKLFYGFALTFGVLTMPLSADDCCYLPQYDCCDYYDEVDFSGFYVGGNVGVFSHTAHRNDLDGFLTDNSGWTTIDTNVEAGVQIGYDWQWCNKLFGLVADWNWVNTDRKVLDDPNGIGTGYVRNRADWFTTIRARAGLTISDALVYITLGAAVTRFHNDWRDVQEFNHHNTRWGWVGGAGTEFMLGCHWSIGAEVLYLHFSQETHSFTTGGSTYAFSHSDSNWVGRVLLNYRFGDLFSYCCD